MSLFRRCYEIDARTLACLRIALGALLLLDLGKRLPDLELWYTNAGLLPNHRMLWQPARFQLSYLFALHTSTEVQVAFAVSAAIYVCFLVGYRTRLMHLLSWVCLSSLHVRTGLLVNGGDYVFTTLLLWTAFLPLGRRYSVDALRRPLPEAERERPVASLAVSALWVQLAVIYLFNALNKTGSTWADGSAVHYLLHQERIVTNLGLWAREHLPSGVFAGLSYGTLAVEYALPALIVCPWFGPWPRRVAIASIWGFHGSIALLTNLGLFSPVMMVFGLSLLSPEDHRWLCARPRLVRIARHVRSWFQSLLLRVRMREAGSSQPAPLTPLGARLTTLATWLREGCVVWLVACAFSQLVLENHGLLGALSHDQPRAVRATVGYLRLNQGWGMFAPDAPLQDQWLVVDAVTVSGEHVDPFNERASRVADPSLRTIPPRLGQNVYFCDYTVRLPFDPLFHEPFEQWIFEHHRRVRDPRQEIVRFDAYLIEHDSPAVGAAAPKNSRARPFLRAKRPPPS